MTTRQPSRSRTAMAALAVVVLATVCTAGTVTLTPTYDGLPVPDVLPAYGYAQVTAWDTATQEREVYPVDASAGEMAIEIPGGTYNLALVFATAPFDGRTRVLAGDVRFSAVGLEVPDVGTVALDAELLYSIHLLSPVDNSDGYWGGSGRSCPRGPEVPASFTLAWGPVPQVELYELRAISIRCPDGLSSQVVETRGTSVGLVIDPQIAESMQLVVQGHSAGGRQLVFQPTVIYDDVGTNRYMVHATASRPGGSGGARTALQVARAPGVGTSFWTSDLTLSNPADAPVTATVVFTPRGADGLNDFHTASLPLPARGTRVIPDVVGGLFGLESAGSLEVRPHSVQGWVRTSTTGGCGRYGQGFPLMAADDQRVASLAGPARVGTGGVVRGDARTNLAVAELSGAPTTVAIHLLDRDGAPLGTAQRSLRPFENIQLNDVVRVVTAQRPILDEGRLVVEVVEGDGRVAAALSIVDNGSDDPTTVVLEPF